jgi:hypothetical protein
MRWTVTVTAEDDDGFDTIELTLPSEKTSSLQITYNDIYYSVEMLPTVNQVPENTIES